MKLPLPAPILLSPAPREVTGSHLVPFSYLADDFPGGWINSGERFLADSVVPLIVYEDLQEEGRKFSEPALNPKLTTSDVKWKKKIRKNRYELASVMRPRS